jgi:flavodoxin
LDKHVGGIEVLIGTIVYSRTGATLDFADRIAQKLRERGHAVELTVLKTDGQVRPPRPKDFRLVNVPDCDKYDAVLVGGPVWAMTAAPPVIVCIESLKGVAGKKLLPFVTMRFPFEGMGGTRAIEAMKKAAESVGAIVMPGIIVPRLFRRHSRLKDAAAQRISEWCVD